MLKTVLYKLNQFEYPTESIILLSISYILYGLYCIIPTDYTQTTLVYITMVYGMPALIMGLSIPFPISRCVGNRIFVANTVWMSDSIVRFVILLPACIFFADSIQHFPGLSAGFACKADIILCSMLSLIANLNLRIVRVTLTDSSVVFFAGSGILRKCISSLSLNYFKNPTRQHVCIKRHNGSGKIEIEKTF